MEGSDQRIRNRKGLLQSTIAIIIVILLSTAILIGFLYNFTNLFTSQVDRGTCRASVELRGASIPSAIATQIEKTSIPLRCKTNYYCLSMGGTCPEGYTKIKVSSTQDIQREVAYYMYDCWWTLGEGKIDFFSEAWYKNLFGVGSPQSSCIICSNIVFDDEVKKKIKEIDMAPYLASAVVPKTNVSYLAYFADKTDVKYDSGVQAEKLSTDKKYSILFFGLKGGDFLKRLGQDAELLGTGAAGSMVVIGPFATGKLAVEAVKLGAKLLPGWGKLALLVPAIAQMSFEGWSKHVAAMHCSAVTEKTTGCFILSLIEYDASTIGPKCANIESIP